ncbi:MAG: NAD-dependent epimerase/dehydratase family protein [Anaerolineae bacterium]|nr:NAD-dependent epimerase/dehydratase family protein [Anaerolineae bacterium]
MRILVTGGAGFIGSHLVDRLLAQEHTVSALDNLSTGRPENLSHLCSHAAFQLVQGDILDVGLVDRLVAEADMVYHLAAAVGVAHVVRDPLGGLRTNVRGTENVLEACARYRRPVLLASSSEVYGRSRRIPFREDGERILGPTTVTRWAYATAKAVDEHLALAYASQEGLRVSIVRYFNTYGPRLDPQGYGSVIARFVGQALRGEPLTVHGDGKQTRSFTYVDDTVSGTILAATKDEGAGEIFNIGSRRETSVRELAEQILVVTGSRSPIIFLPHEQVYGARFEDPPRRRPSVRKAARLLGFRARIPMEEGLRRTLEYFQ